MSNPLNRRDALRLGVSALAAGTFVDRTVASDLTKSDAPARPFLTPGKDFRDVSRGDPIPHTLKGDALVKARLTPETWRLEIVADDRKAKGEDDEVTTVENPLTLANGKAIDLPTLLKLGEKHAIRFLKAMQCSNIPLPLGQGLWEGVPLREVLRLCGKSTNVRRVFYWGFHNEKPEQKFQSSLALNQVLDVPPGEMPPLLAYKLNGEPIPLARGGPVRLIVPWAHGFKSIKWLQKIILTNDFAANDTYAEQNNDPESYLKTAAYFEDTEAQKFAAGKPITLRGTAMVGWPGLERVEYWLRPAAEKEHELADNDAAWSMAEWKPGQIDPPPRDWGVGLPAGVLPKAVWGFSPAGKPKEWPLRFSIAHWTLTIPELKAGKYELRVRTVDKNGFEQPEPRTNQQSGRNKIKSKLLEVS